MKNDNENKLPPILKLKWACRRGMLELDVLLGNFLDRRYVELPYEDKLLFIKLLDCDDPELFACLMGHKQAADHTLLRIINEIRKHARA